MNHATTNRDTLKIRVIRVICENPRFRLVWKIEIDKPVYAWYDKLSESRLVWATQLARI